MYKYAILKNPGHNRVYYKESRELSLSEIAIAAESLSCDCTNIQNEIIQGTPYCTFNTSSALSKDDINIISRLSFLFVLFEIKGQDEIVSFIPIKKNHLPFVDEKITTVLKYKGKTNELFTKMMINIAWLVCETKRCDSLLDPMCGKGTTLFEGMVCGLNVCGIEMSKQSAHDGSVFIKKYFEHERYKHTTQKRTISNSSKKSIGKGIEFEYGNKDDFKNKTAKKIEIIEGDAPLANMYYKKNSFDIIVCDLPYGVQHSNKNSNTKDKSRSPLELLKRCLPSWQSVLKKDGAIVFAFNTHVLKKQEALLLLESAGFLALYKHINFDHFVDSSIQRDIIIAKK